MDATSLRARTHAFALSIVRLCAESGHGDIGRLVRPQLFRAGTGVAANYRAACRSRSRKEFASRLAVVVEEADEAEYWLDILGSLTTRSNRLTDARREAIELRAIFARARATTLSNLPSGRLAMR